MNIEIATPKNAAAVILFRSGANSENLELCWARRSRELKFLSGYHAFPGGRVEPNDSETIVQNCDDNELKILMACAARECFEEVGVLLARGGEKMTKGQRASLRDDLTAGRMSFAEILAHWDLWLDADDFRFVGAWTTPPFSSVRFKTSFFLVNCPAKQEPFAASGELENVEFVKPQYALAKWTRGEILCAPPILNAFRFLAKGAAEKSSQELLKLAEQEGAHPRKIEFNPHITVFPLKTKTLPPATHTNCFIVGRREFVVIDAAADESSEQNALHEFVDSIVEDKGVCRAIFVSHSHPDHLGGERALQKHLSEKYDQTVPLATHALTAKDLPHIRFDELFDGETFYDLSDTNNQSFQLQILHLPGHARGHVCFYDAEFGFLLSSDNVVGTGSVLISPPAGNMKDYLNSLEKMRDLRNLRFLCGSHGPAIADARGKIESFIKHRLTREQEILRAWREGAQTPPEIVAKVYANVEPALRGFAEKSVLAHLEKLREDNLLST